MSNPYKLYLSLGGKIEKEKNILATFYLRSDSQPLDLVAGGVAAESSVGTWTDVIQEEKLIWEKLHGKVIELDKEKGILQIAYPLELFEPNNIPQLLSSIAGNVFGLSEATSLRLLDLELPEIYVNKFPGPAFGIGGIRKITGIDGRPLIGSIIKPKLGLSSKEHLNAVMAVFNNGLDLVKDDENLTSLSFNSFYERVDEITGKMVKEGFLGRGREKIYAFNITAGYEEMLKRAEYVSQKSGNCLMMDILTCGFAGVCGIRNRNFGKVIHAHRAMHAAITRSKEYGISMLVIAKLARLAGVDTLHTGTVVGKMEGEKEEVIAINNFLRSDWHGLKTVLPVASGGLHPGLVPRLIQILGSQMLFNFGGGIHGHPKGSAAGARAVVQAFECFDKKIPLGLYAKEHQELSAALLKWGEK